MLIRNFTNRLLGFAIRAIWLSLPVLGFCSPSWALVDLKQVYQDAQKTDPDYLRAVATLQKALQSEPKVLGELFPQIGLQAYWKGEKSSASATTEVNRTTLSFGIALNQSIFNLSLWREIAAKKLEERAALAIFNAAKQRLIGKIIVAYFAVLQADDILNVATIEKEALYQEFQRTTKMAEVGTKTKVDVQYARASYYKAVADYIVARNGVASSIESLWAITMKRYDSFRVLDPHREFSSICPKGLNESLQRSLKNNWNLVAARYQTLAASRALNAEDGTALPTVTGSLGYAASQVTPKSGPSITSPGVSAQVTLNFPVFTGGVATAKRNESRANYRLALLNQQRTSRVLEQTVRDLFLTLINLQKKITADEASLSSFGGSLMGSIERYKVGIQTIIEVLNAQEAFYNAQRALATDKYNYVVNLTNLREAEGILQPDDLLEINKLLIDPKPKKESPSGINKILAGNISQKEKDQYLQIMELTSFKEALAAENDIKEGLRKKNNGKSPPIVLMKETKSDSKKSLYRVLVSSSEKKEDPDLEKIREQLKDLGYKNLIDYNDKVHGKE